MIVILRRGLIARTILCIILLRTIDAQSGDIGTGDATGLAPPQEALPAQTRPRKWMTLTGSPPEIVARGGYAGFFPSSSFLAYHFALDVSLPGLILYCNLHFTKDHDAFCVEQINLENTTNIAELDPNGGKTYNINGREIHGWFGIDYPAHFIFENLTLQQNIFTRQPGFDGSMLTAPSQIYTDAFNMSNRVWLNIENDIFYQQHKISPENFILNQLHNLPEFISSSEIGFLKSIRSKLGNVKTKLVFTFLEENAVELTTGANYGSLRNNLPMIKSFASGIVVPKEYIWPVNKDRVLQPATTLVQDAHKQGLAVYASGFANDHFLSYNYSYDPVREYLQFVDNSQFSVDGVLSDFPSTASEAIGCMNTDKNAPKKITTLIISHNGASGDYPGATDLAYHKAIDDGADIIDCSVRMSKDGTAFCSDRSDLLKTTTAATIFMDVARNVPEVQPDDGIFSFDLMWSEIQSLKPQMQSFFSGDLVRNPATKNSGKFVTLTEFLELAKTKEVPGVLISINNAAFLAHMGLDIVATIQNALKNIMLDRQRVLIQSDDTSVLLKFKDNPKYERVLYIKESISGVPEQVGKEIKKYADAVFLHRDSVVVVSNHFALNFTKTILALHNANCSVYVGILRNEFVNLIFDYFSDPYAELATLVSEHVDGLVTEYPATANLFARSSCATNGSAYVINPIKPAFFIIPDLVAEPPLLSTSEVVDPPLPTVANNSLSAPVSAPANSNTTPSRGSTSSTVSLSVGAEGLLLAAVLALVTIFS